jgi:UPF0716 protein FxsA
MFLFLFALLILIPIIEITVLIQVSEVIGGWNAIGLIVLISMLGAWLMRHEGFIVMRRIREQVELGRAPNNELIDGFLVLFGGLLMLTPGFVTDAIGLVMVFPLSRVAVRTVIRKRFARNFGFVTRLPQTWGSNGQQRPDDDVIDV